VCNGWYYQHVYKNATLVRGGLVTEIFRKLLQLPMSEKLESQTITLMSSDVERIMSSSVYLHETWASILEMLIATWLLVLQLGVSSISVFGLAVGK
jgi:ATP-binding cassette, subfamily C (CFTR/MRP), member 1